MTRRSVLVLFVLFVLFALVACDNGDGGDATPEATAASPTASPTDGAPATATPSPEATATATTTPPANGEGTADLSEARLSLEPILDGRAFEQPVEFAPYPAGPAPDDSVYVAERDGRVLVFVGADEHMLLDLREQVRTAGNEEGLLSVTLDPAFEDNGHVWVYYSAAGDTRLTRLSRFAVDLENQPLAIDPGSELAILAVEQPYSNHNGGAIRFGPDGMLYLGLGDGGDAGDPHGNGQDPGTLLGSVIRIDVSESSAEEPYRVPDDNPLVDRDGARAEIWAFGLRNPWRMEFDPETDELWLADVGQDRAEEIDVIVPGGNYGWNRMEGFGCFEPSEGCDGEALVLPVAAYAHDEYPGVCSVTGGVVYRGEDVPALTGRYLFADFCSGHVWAIEAEPLPEAGADLEPTVVFEDAGQIASFALDARGEIHLLAFGSPIRRIVAD